ncbi:zinc ribbon domain-containing protein [Weissella ceti]
MKLKKYCQSCGIKLTAENAGTNADGSESHLYCGVCFVKGRYTQPYLTYRDMVKRGYVSFKEQNLPWCVVLHVLLHSQYFCVLWPVA